ncbi:MAG: hypothetical protein M1839_005019 [Geoglossum umbratile]|nr:MAG: hypothetical protein M1839_005019 [Geoglossum umbratile]
MPQRIPIGLSAEFTEDGAIVDRASYLNNRIFQHAEYYYHRDSSAGQPQTPELHDRRSRHAAIRQELARRIIESVTLSQVPRSDAEIMTLSSQASGYLAPYAKPSTGGAREDHLLALFRIGAELQELISSHPSDWGFDGWNSARGFVIGFIVVFPALLKDGEEVMRRETIRVRLN